MFIFCVIVFVCVAGIGCYVVSEMNRQKRVKENESQMKVLGQAPTSQLIGEQSPVFFQGPCHVDGPVSDP